MDLKKELGGVADAVTKIMMDEKALHPNQQKLDVHEPEKDELTADDFKKLRAGKKAPEVKKEEVEELDELSKSTLGSYVNKASDSAAKNAAGSVGMANTSLRAKNPRVKAAAEKYSNEDEATKQKRLSGIGKAVKKLTKEAVEQIDEYKSTGGVYKHKGTYGTEKSLEAGYTDFDKENELAKKNLKDKKPKKYGARQNFVRSTRVNESFTSILASYKENGLKGISEMFATEQASQEEYEKEIEKAKAKSQGKDKAEVAKASVQAVKSEQTHTKIEVIDMTDPYNIQKREIDLEERMMTEPEMKKKEEIVKSMKKGMKGFKERYGERAKEVMHATATKQAMKD